MTGLKILETFFKILSKNDFSKILNKKSNSNTRIYTVDANSINHPNSGISQNSDTFFDLTKMSLLWPASLLRFWLKFFKSNYTLHFPLMSIIIWRTDCSENCFSMYLKFEDRICRKHKLLKQTDWPQQKW